MFNFGGITHIGKNPAGTFSATGDVPVGLMNRRNPTRADIMGQRVQSDGFAYTAACYPTLEDALAAAKTANAKLCASAGCACRKLF